MAQSGGGDGSNPSPGAGALCVEDAYKKHCDLLRGIAETKFNIPPADAEGIVNEVFTAYLLRRDVVRNARKWLIGAVCHASRAYWRDAAKTAPLPEDAALFVDPSSPGLEGRIVDRVTMARALTEVGPKCRETLRMYYAEGYSAAEMAARLGTSSGYVMQLLHTCRKQVRKAYDSLKAKRQEKR
ncbi:MAG TPA: sigma-70 family RNA polymerase sigma factor [Thermoanaerobaculia bacterium]|nr:sigma-70 family RNA polymerase sigma factor [Thermoanaerobaculia bacterium]